MKKSNLQFYLTTTGKWMILLLASLVIIVGALSFQDKLSQFRSLGLLGIFLANLIASTTIFIPVPGIVTVVAGGIIYSPLLVALVATLGATTGDMVAYLLGISSKKVFIKKEHALYQKGQRIMHRFGPLVIFFFAFFPNPFFDAVGILAGALGYPLVQFVFWLFLGRLLRNILLAFFGAGL